MVALTITDANVAVNKLARFETKKALSAIGPGRAVYWDPVQDGFGLFDADSATQYVNRLFGVSVGQGAAAGQFVTAMQEGELDFGVILTKGQVYIGGAAAGAIHPIADIIATWRIQQIGQALSTSRLSVLVRDLGVAV